MPCPVSVADSRNTHVVGHLMHFSLSIDREKVCAVPCRKYETPDCPTLGCYARRPHQMFDLRLAWISFETTQNVNGHVCSPLIGDNCSSPALQLTTNNGLPLEVRVVSGPAGKKSKSSHVAISCIFPISGGREKTRVMLCHKYKILDLPDCGVLIIMRASDIRFEVGLDLFSKLLRVYMGTCVPTYGSLCVNEMYHARRRFPFASQNVADHFPYEMYGPKYRFPLTARN